MTSKPPTNLGASVQARLRNLSFERGEANEGLLERFALEGLLRRLGISTHRDRFVLKGAMLFRVWSSEVYRPTRDADFLGLGSPSPERIVAAFQEICGIPCPDGMTLDPASVVAAPIRLGQRYLGIRVDLNAHIGSARLRIQADIGYGDDAFPTPVEAEYPPLLDFPPPRLWMYARETVVAEKLDALLVHGETNTRIKDFFDLWVLGRHWGFNGPIVVEAIARTFSRRSTSLPVDTPAGLTYEFFNRRTDDWDRFFARGRLREAKRPFTEVGELLRAFLLPPLNAVLEAIPFIRNWPPGGPWREP